MAFCTNCGSPLPDGSFVCPACGARQQPPVQSGSQYGYQQNNVYQKIPNQQQNVVYEQAPYQPPVYDYYYVQQKTAFYTSEVSTSTVLGVIAIICAILSSFILVCWICGGIGHSKASAAMNFARETGNQFLYKNAQNAKKLNSAALIISGVMVCVAVVAAILFALVFSANGTSIA